MSGDTWERILISATSAVVIISAFIAGIRGFKKWIAAQVVVPAQTAVTVARGVSEQVTRVETQVHSNHGTSMADDVTKIDRKVDVIDGKVTTLGVRFDDHLRLGHPPTEGN